MQDDRHLHPNEKNTPVYPSAACSLPVLSVLRLGRTTDLLASLITFRRSRLGATLRPYAFLPSPSPSLDVTYMTCRKEKIANGSNNGF